jgi:DNA-binding transcriptional LysR family regulator
MLDLNLKRIAVLREIGLTGSFSAAADALSYTQSAVSQQVIALERHLGVQLVERSCRPVELTEAGRLLVSHFEAILAQLASAHAELDALSSAACLGLAFFPGTPANLLRPVLSVIASRHPGTTIDVRERAPKAAESELRGGTVELAIVCRAPLGGDDPQTDITSRVLYEEPYVVVMPRRHPLARRPRLLLADVAEEPLVAAREPSDACGRLEVALADAGVAPNVVMQADCVELTLDFIACGHGIACIPRSEGFALPPDLVAREIQDPLPARCVVVCRRRGEPLSPPARTALRALEAQARQFASAWSPSQAAA